MKRKFIYVMLAVLLAPLAMNAQNRSTLTVYDQNTTTNEYVPIYGYYADSKSMCEFIIPKEKISAMNGGVISAMKFYLDNSSSGSYYSVISATFNVFVKEVSATTLSGLLGQSGATTVFNSTITIAKGASNVEINIPFSSNYVYGGGNLLIGFYQTATTGYNHTYWTGETQDTNTAWGGYDGSTSAQKFLPKTTFTYEIITTPTITLPATATVLTGFTTTLTANTMNVTGTPTITYASSNPSVATVSGSGTTATVTGVSAGTATITATMTYNGNTYTSTCTVTVEDPSYCTPGTGNYDNDGIYNVTFGTNGVVVNNTVSGIDYGDYSNLVGAVDAGTTDFEVAITYKTGYTYGTIIWVDWNKNYTFEGATEVVYAGQSGSTNPTTLTATFDIPSTAAGDYRMRIIGADQALDSYTGSISAAASVDACGSFNWSTCHDYTLRVVALGAYTITCATTTGGTISADKTSADENDVITITATPETDYLLTALTYTPEGGSAQSIDITNTPYTFTMPAANVTVNATFTLPGNLPPYNLTVGTPLGHSVVLGWTGVSTNVNHQNYEVYYSTNNSAPSDNISSGYQTTTTVPYTLEGLNPTTTYYAWVRDNCGTDGKSAWVAFNSFTTDVACGAPNTLTVNNLTAHSAHVSWNGEAESYTVKYSTATIDGTTLDPVFEDGFESGLGSWTIYATAYNNASYNWQQYDLSSAEVEPYNHSGDYVAMSRSWVSGTGDQSVDNWLVTPQMTLGDVVKFWVSCNDQYRDSYAVYVSTGSNVVTSSSIGDFVLVKSYAEATGTWTEIPVDISAYAGQQGYVAIRHTNYGGDKLNVDDFGVYNTINTYSYGGWTTVSPNPTTESCQLTGLSAETLYEVQVQANCGGTDGSSAWSTIHFTTPDNCGAPQELASSNVTINSATLSWADDKDSYNLQYRKVYFYEDFESSDGIPTGWTTINNSTTAGSLNWQVLHLTNHSGNNSVGSGSYIYQNTGITPDNWLISPQLDLQGTLRVWLSGYGDRNSEHFEILLSTTGTSVSDFTTTLVAESTTTNSYVEYTADLSSYTGKGYIAIHHFNCSDQNYLCVDDFGLYGSENWVTLNPDPTTETANLTGLTPNTGYEWQVRGVNCDGNGGTTEWSDVATFTTLEGYTKDITAYNGDGGWYFIASPVTANVTPAANNGFLTSDYDLYYFNQNGDSEGNEWINFEDTNDGGFIIVNGQGYLYASSTNTTLVFTGSAYTGNGQVNLTYSTANADETMHGWNLVGNPFAQSAYINMPFYTLDGGSEYVEHAAGDEIQRMQGILVHTDANATLTFSTTAPSKGSMVSLNVSQNRAIVDRAIVNFGEGHQLPKFQINPNHTKIYMPVDGKDYAVANAENQGEMPVNFKAEKNGTYTLSFNAENVEFGYLHLIDNMTGNDVDLLSTPSYTFEAKTTDYASRFKLVFNASANDDSFAFFNGSEWVINNEGNATLQVIDIMGRVISSETINGNANVNINEAAGVYVIRLINGENVRTQKVVVK